MPSQQASSYPAPKPTPSGQPGLPSPLKTEEEALFSASEEAEVAGFKAKVQGYGVQLVRLYTEQGYLDKEAWG